MVEGELSQESFDIELKAADINNNEEEARNMSLAVILSFIIFFTPEKSKKKTEGKRFRAKENEKFSHLRLFSSVRFSYK